VKNLENVYMIKFNLLLIPLLACTALQAKDDSIKIDEKYRQFMNNYCIDCHNAKKKKGKVRLDAEGFSFEIKTIKDADQWQHILNAVNAQEMPPEDETQPKAEEKLNFLEMLSDKLVDARAMLSDAGGKTLMRRLNRREYENTMKDLLGVQIDSSNLPNDQSGSSFDTDGGSLFMSSDQIEQYLTVARNGIHDSLIKTYMTKPEKLRIQPEVSANRSVKSKEQKYKKHYENALAYEKSKDPKKKFKDFKLIDQRDIGVAKSFYSRFHKSYKNYLINPLSKTGSLLSLWHPHRGDRMTIGSVNVKVPVKNTGKKNNQLKAPAKTKTKKKWLPNGLYKVRARVGLLPNANPDRAFLDVGFQNPDRSFKRAHTFHVTAPASKGQIVETVIEIANNRTLFFQEKQSEEAARFQYSSTRKKSGSGPTQAIWVDWIEWEGPINIKRPSIIEKIASKMKGKADDQTVKSLLSEFARRAFRGDQVSPAYFDRLLQIYKIERAEKKKPLEAIIEPMAIILASPGFIYISEPAKDKEVKELSQRELAIRLAYFLWSSPPDNELYNLAIQGKLKDDKTLYTQVNRMLKDKKAEQFYSSFAYQWLGMDRLHFFQFDHYRFPHFDDTMKSAAAEEVYKTIQTIVDENLSTEKLLKSDFVVINGMLANHYGIPNVKGDHFRKVKLPHDSVRGGLTGMAAIHAMGSDGKHTSPVERGAWVLRKILNQPPPPAPANVPQLNRLEGKKLTVRQMLKAHQEEPQCAHCHTKIDPIGFGLENFDPVGQWRTVDKLNKMKTKVDPSGQLYKGPSFKNYKELRDIFVTRVDNFNRGLIKNLLGYSLGRSIGFSDQDLIDELHQKMKKNNNSMRSLIHEIVKSKVFKTKK